MTAAASSSEFTPAGTDHLRRLDEILSEVQDGLLARCRPPIAPSSSRCSPTELQ
jgi:hypothetical protein